jgi:hypothetical protein
MTHSSTDAHRRAAEAHEAAAALHDRSAVLHDEHALEMRGKGEIAAAVRAEQIAQAERERAEADRLRAVEHRREASSGGTAGGTIEA